MNNVAKISLMFILGGIVAGFTGEQSGGRDSRKQSVNLSGTLVTQMGHKEYNVENISIANMLNDIRLFQLPDTPVGPLSEDPHAGVEFKVNLEKGVVIEVPTPRRIWSYKRNERASKVEYIAIAFTPCDKGEKEEYIVETTRPVLCERFEGACKSIPMRIPLSQIERLKITDSKPWDEPRACQIKPTKEHAETKSQALKELRDEKEQVQVPVKAK